MIQDPQELLGQHETHRLEFKAADVLRRSATVGREVVAFLNADGGEVWIGVEESDGKAVSLQAIPEPARARDALRDQLVNTLEPSPTMEEVLVDVVGGLVRVVVGKGRRRPYALHRDRGRQYVLRIGDRVREMTREEIAEAFGSEDSRNDTATGMRELQVAIDGELESPRERFWWRLLPRPALPIDFEHSDRQTEEFFRELLTDPVMSGNRPHGWTMIFLDDRFPKIATDGVTHTFGTGSVAHGINITKDGTMTFWAPSIRLLDLVDDGPEILPFALLELPVSAFRIASKVYSRFGSERTASARTVVCGATVGGIAGHTLRSGSPNAPPKPSKRPATFEKGHLVVKPFEIDAKQIITSPDAAAYRLVRRIYEEFGLGLEDIPDEFDRKDHVLRLGR